MDTAFYNAMAQTALDLITSKGRDDLTLERKQASSYDPHEDVEIPAQNLSQSIRCVVLPVSKGTVEAFDNRLEGGTLIESNLRLLKIAAKGLTFEPKAGDIVPSLEGSRWVALGSTPVNPAGIPLVYSVTVKRG